MDVREFYNKVYKSHTSGMTQATMEIDYGYSNMNTIWIQNDTTLEAKIMKNVKRKMYGKPHILNVTYRDITKTFVGKSLPTSPSTHSSSSQVMSRAEVEDPDILVFLDTFKTQFHKSLYKTVPQRVPIMAPSIRQTVRNAVMASDRHERINTVHQGNSNWPRFYAAVHIRGGDGDFVSSLDETIEEVFKGITAVIVQWLKGNSQLLPKGECMPVVGLYVATDIRNIHQNIIFNVEALKLGSLLTKEHNVHLMLLYPEDSMATGSSETNDSKTQPTASTTLGGTLYADLFWDIEVCACAPIVFDGSGTPVFSSLSKLIQGIHRSSRC